MKKINYKKRLKKIGERTTKITNENETEISNPNDKKCPFNDKVCNERCKLFRNKEGTKGYECLFQEIGAISWNLKEFVKKIID